MATFKSFNSIFKGLFIKLPVSLLESQAFRIFSTVIAKLPLLAITYFIETDPGPSVYL